MQTSRAPAISVSAESCIPAGLRLGPVPGIFKLGKYLSDRREPGPKKKVFSYRLSCTAGPCFFVDSGEAGLGEDPSILPSQSEPGKERAAFPERPEMSPRGFARKACPFPLPFLPTAGAPLARPWTQTCRESRRSPLPGDGGRWSRCPAPAPQSSAHSGIAFFPAGPGRATAASSAWLEPRLDGGMRLSQAWVLSGEEAGGKAVAPIYF